MSIKYFGIEATYNPFSNAEDLQQVSNAIFSITDEPNFATTYAVSVSTGLVPTAISFLSADFSATILDADGTTTIQILKAKLGGIGNNEYPQVDEIVWFDVEGMQSAFWLHSDYLGKQLKISGKFQTTAITGEFLNKNIEQSIVMTEYINKYVEKSLVMTEYINKYVKKSLAQAGDIKASFGTRDHGNWLFCNGRSVSSAAYRELYNYLVSVGMARANASSFNIPDMRGRYMMCVDAGRGLDGDRYYRGAMFSGTNTGDRVGTIQHDAIRNIVGHVTTDGYGDVDGKLFSKGEDGELSGKGQGSGFRANFNASRVVPTGANNRPNNVAVGIFICYL